MPYPEIRNGIDAAIMMMIYGTYLVRMRLSLFAQYSRTTGFYLHMSFEITDLGIAALAYLLLLRKCTNKGQFGVLCLDRLGNYIFLYHAGDNFGPPFALNDYLKAHADRYISIKFPMGFAKNQYFEFEYYHQSIIKHKYTKKINREQIIGWHGDTFKDILLELIYQIKSLLMITKQTRCGIDRYDMAIGADPICAYFVTILKMLGLTRQTTYANYNDVTPLRSERKFFNQSYNFLIKHCLRNCDYVWYRWRKHRDEVIRKYGTVREKNAVMVPIGVDMPKNLPRSASMTNHTIVSAKNVSETAGLQLLVEIMPELIQKIPDLRFTIIGVGKYLPTLQRMVQDLSLEQHVFFLGQKPRSEVINIISTCSIGYSLYLPTKYRKTMEIDTTMESIGGTTSTMEMLGVGLPVIATNGMGISYEIKEYNAGLVIDWNKNELYDAVIDLLSDASKYNSRSYNAMVLAQKYNWSNIFDYALQGKSINMGPT